MLSFGDKFRFWGSKPPATAAQSVCSLLLRIVLHSGQQNPDRRAWEAWRPTVSRAPTAALLCWTAGVLVVHAGYGTFPVPYSFLLSPVLTLAFRFLACPLLLAPPHCPAT